MSVFVDTSAWFAIRVQTDMKHVEAESILRRLLAEGEGLITTDWIFSETIALIRRRKGPMASVESGDWILAAGAVELHVLDREQTAAAWERYKANGGKVSLVDCSSFVVLEALGLDRVFAFDDDFAAARFRLERPQG